MGIMVACDPYFGLIVKVAGSTPVVLLRRLPRCEMSESWQSDALLARPNPAS